MATQEELKAAFELVEDKKHWKNPIDTWVPVDVNIDLIREAIIHFTATVPTIIMCYRTLPHSKKRETGYLVRAAGYWAGPAA